VKKKSCMVVSFVWFRSVAGDARRSLARLA
jgi:hypothetical protein